MNVTINKISLRGKMRWMVCQRYKKKDAYVKKRQFFETKAQAEAEQAQLLLQQEQAGAAWLTLPPGKRNELIAVNKEIEDAGMDLRSVWEFFKSNRVVTVVCSLGEAKAIFYAEKEQARLSKKSMEAFRSILGRFVAGREEAALHLIRREDCLSWLHTDGWSERTFNGYLTYLKIFFNWCVETGRLKESPVKAIKKISYRQMSDIDKPPAIVTVDQCRALMEATLKVDKKLIPYVALCLFAGLRPQREAAMMTWDCIKDGAVRVLGLNAKSRQRRDVPLNDTLAAWLALGGDLPVKNLRKRFERVRLAAGSVTRNEKGELVGWTQDCMRHTFASNYMTIHGAEKTIAAMGHGNYDMLFKHYRDIVSEPEAKKFWSVLPQ